MTSSSPFVDDVTAALEAATEHGADAKPHRFRGDVVNEAFNLAVRLHRRRRAPHRQRAVGADRPPSARCCPTPTWCGRRRPRSAAAASSPASGAWLDQPSTLFELLVDADRVHAPAFAPIYYRRALDVAHTLASLDDITDRGRARAIGGFRSMLLDRIARPTTDEAGPCTRSAPDSRARGQPSATAAATRRRADRAPSRSCWPSSTRWSAWPR